MAQKHAEALCGVASKWAEMGITQNQVPPDIDPETTTIPAIRVPMGTSGEGPTRRSARTLQVEGLGPFFFGGWGGGAIWLGFRALFGHPQSHALRFGFGVQGKLLHSVSSDGLLIWVRRP